MTAYGSIAVDPPTIVNDDDSTAAEYESLISPSVRRHPWAFQKHHLGGASLAGAFLVLLFVAFGMTNTSDDYTKGLPTWSPTLQASFFPDGRLPRPKSGDNVAKYYSHQKVDHFSDAHKHNTYSQKYYQSKQFFKGPGHPFLVVICGEDATDEGLLYPYVNQYLASLYGAYVIQLEHRFYGESQPTHHHSHHKQDGLPTPDELKTLLTPYQAMADAAQIIQHKQKQYGCSMNKSSKRYCPVITIGGSMPGCLAALMRVIYPDVVDIAYASSSPLRLYSQSTSRSAYYEKVTDVAERASPGCAHAVRTVLNQVTDRLVGGGDDDAGRELFETVASEMGICIDTIPSYIQTAKTFQEELMIIVATGFADCNMAYYPPGPDTELVTSCTIFKDATMTAEEKVGKFLAVIVDDEGDGSATCFDMTTQLPPGQYGTISAADWSGVGGGPSGYSWDFQTCDMLVCPVSFSEKSMLPTREWSYAWLTEHCQTRFDLTPEPTKLVNEIGFNDLVGIGATRILFVNGINDGWSVASHLEPLSDTIRAVNIINGAHHSDLSHVGPSEADTPDMTEAYVTIAGHLTNFLQLVKEEHRK